MTERERRCLGMPYDWYVAEFRKSCFKIGGRIATEELLRLCNQPDSPEARESIATEARKVAAECAKFRVLEGADLAVAAKQVLGQGRLL